jgi:hypothetical protein
VEVDEDGLTINNNNLSMNLSQTVQTLHQMDGLRGIGMGAGEASLGADHSHILITAGGQTGTHHRRNTTLERSLGKRDADLDASLQHNTPGIMSPVLLTQTYFGGGGARLI